MEPVLKENGIVRDNAFRVCHTINTKYLSCTNTLPTRYKATLNKVSITMSYNSGISDLENAHYAARLVYRKMRKLAKLKNNESWDNLVISKNVGKNSIGDYIFLLVEE
jgi:hypothetical protein